MTMKTVDQRRARRLQVQAEADAQRQQAGEDHLEDIDPGRRITAPPVAGSLVQLRLQGQGGVFIALPPPWRGAFMVHATAQAVCSRIGRQALCLQLLHDLLLAQPLGLGVQDVEVIGQAALVRVAISTFFCAACTDCCACLLAATDCRVTTWSEMPFRACESRAL
jgi:hypothetical protein